MAIMTARQGQHGLIQYLKNPKVRERHSWNNPPVDKDEDATRAEDAPQVRPATKDL